MRLVPSPSVVPTESPEPSKAEVVVTLNDRGGTISVDRAGNVTGLDDVPAATRDVIAKVLLSERIDRPPNLRDLGDEDSALRGSNRDQSFILISPSRTVIVSDRPTFKWETVQGASAYTVYVNDASGQMVAKSGELTADRRHWQIPKSLRRGEMYTWAVTAMVDDKEKVFPGPSAPEMKFHVLSAAHLRRLNELSRSHSHLALGIFYTNVGMLAEAEREFLELAGMNSNSKIPSNLLNNVRLLRRQ
jgi:hypothetical protein